jgi:hypothetical protein
MFMDNKSSTEKQLNILIEFRQAVYQWGFTKRRDAMFELLDALLLRGPVRSFARLSLCLTMQRQWPSLYAAIEEGEIDVNWLRSFLASQIPGQGLQIFALDSTAWPRPSGRTLPDRQYIYHPTGAVDGGLVTIGYPYSLLDWVPAAPQSWALSVDVKRVPIASTAIAQGVQQIKDLVKARQAYCTGLDIIVADQSYGNHKFFQPLQGQACGVLAALRPNRVLYRAPTASEQRHMGRKKKHGQRLVFKDPDTWAVPDESLTFQDERWGQVEIRRWNQVHERAAADTPLDVLCIQVHLEKAKPPRPLWLGWQAPPVMPDQISITSQWLWQAYQHRWSIESGIRFRKQNLMWTVPQFQLPEAGDCWSILVSLAVWILYLARDVVTDQPLPWQTVQRLLTPGRVQQSIGELFCKIGTPVRPVKTRGKSPGWPKGKVRGRRKRHFVLQKGPPRRKRTDRAA